MKKEFWITAGLSGLIALFAFFFFVIWRPILTSQETEEGKNTTVKIDQKTADKEEVKPLESGITISNLIQDAEMPKTLEFEPFFEKEEQKIKETFLERFSSLTKLLEIPSLVPVTAPPAPKGESKASSTPKKILTDEEWFKIAYPPIYLEYLNQLEAFMKTKKFLAQGENYEFTSEENIRFFIHKVIDFGLQYNFISKENEEGLRYGIDVVLPSLHKQEKTWYERSLSAFLFRIFDLFSIAYAQNEVTQPECYRVGSGGGSGGSNTWAMCCNCGYYYDGEDYIWYDDCGQNNVNCTQGLGCLNMMCQGKAAIYDSGSGMCGC